ncbi:MAG: cold shock CspA family protein [Neolewinella sp.]|jgi:cold shock CspA family protein|nr:cold shock domain-containing protein [Lewinella sp.]
MQIGIILFYLPEKGYGYLRLLDTREEFHFRKKNLILHEIKAGDLVSFEMKQGSQGYFADQVQRKGIA